MVFLGNSDWKSGKARSQCHPRQEVERICLWKLRSTLKLELQNPTPFILPVLFNIQEGTIDIVKVTGLCSCHPHSNPVPFLLGQSPCHLPLSWAQTALWALHPPVIGCTGCSEHYVPSLLCLVFPLSVLPEVLSSPWANPMFHLVLISSLSLEAPISPLEQVLHVCASV